MYYQLNYSLQEKENVNYPEIIFVAANSADRNFLNLKFGAHAEVEWLSSHTEKMQHDTVKIICGSIPSSELKSDLFH